MTSVLLLAPRGHMEGLPAVHTRATSLILPGDLFHALTPSLLQIVAKKYRNYDFPAEMTGLWRYLKNAYARDEFTNTCAADSEIELAYADVAKRLSRSWTWPSRPIAAAEGLHRLPKDSGFTHFSSTPPLETSVSIRPHLSGILGTPPACWLWPKSAPSPSGQAGIPQAEKRETVKLSAFRTWTGFPVFGGRCQGEPCLWDCHWPLLPILKYLLRCIRNLQHAVLVHPPLGQ